MSSFVSVFSTGKIIVPFSVMMRECLLSHERLLERKEFPWNGICLHAVLLQVSYWTASPHNF